MFTAINIYKINIIYIAYAKGTEKAFIPVICTQDENFEF